MFIKCFFTSDKPKISFIDIFNVVNLFRILDFLYFDILEHSLEFIQLILDFFDLSIDIQSEFIICDSFDNDICVAEWVRWIPKKSGKYLMNWRQIYIKA